MRLACLGDVMLARGVAGVLEKSDRASLWGDCLPALSTADVRLANLECCISDRGRPFEPPRVFSFRAPPLAVEVLQTASIDVVTLANNHSLDYGDEALLDTIERLDAAGIAHVGAGADLARASQPVVIRSGETKIGFVGFTDNYPEYAAGPRRPGTFHVDPDDHDPGPVVRAVRQAREMGADLVVVTAHCGPNMIERPRASLAELARRVIEEGVDLWFGHSAHVFHGVAFQKGRPIIFDGGDFVDDYAVDRRLRNDRSLLWMAAWSNREVVLEAFPVQLDYAQTNLAHGESFDWIARRLSGLCREMGTAVDRLPDRLVVKPAGSVGLY